MALSELRNLLDENRALRAELRSHIDLRREIVDDYRKTLKIGYERQLLLRMAEDLIDAHRIAKIDANGATIDIIADALFHVGGRLAREV